MKLKILTLVVRSTLHRQATRPHVGVWGYGRNTLPSNISQLALADKVMEASRLADSQLNGHQRNLVAFLANAAATTGIGTVGIPEDQ